MSRSDSGAGSYTVGPEFRPGVQCRHPDLELEIDPEPILLAECEREAGFFVPIEDDDPAGICPFHLARFLEDADEELVSRGARDHVQDPAFVTFDDAPPTLDHEEER